MLLRRSDNPATMISSNPAVTVPVLEPAALRKARLAHESGELERQAKITRAALDAFDEELDLCLVRWLPFAKLCD